MLLHRLSVLHADARGWVVEPIVADRCGERGPQNVHMVSVAPGAVRGNHYHARQREFLCLIGSRARIVVVDRATSLRDETEVACDEPLLLEALPNVIHAVKNVGDEMLYLLCYADQPYDRANPDVTRVTVLE